MDELALFCMQVAQLRNRTLQAQRLHRSLAKRRNGDQNTFLSSDWHSDPSESGDSNLSIRTEEMSSDSASSYASTVHSGDLKRAWQPAVHASDTESSIAC